VSDSHEEREERERSIQQEKREDREDRINRDEPDEWKPERVDSRRYRRSIPSSFTQSIAAMQAESSLRLIVLSSNP
jgi:hypothetical protein